MDALLINIKVRHYRLDFWESPCGLWGLHEKTATTRKSKVTCKCCLKYLAKLKKEKSK